MLKKTASYAAPAALALLLGACASQLPAPVIAGNSGNASSASGTAASNPYGETPYQPSGSVSDLPYTPQTASAPAAGSSGGAYIPSYAPVDINAATHTVVRGDTVYNISKRYNISQDDVRSWNGLTDNTISIGQVLRVKPSGYVAPASTPAAVAATAPSNTAATTPTVSTGATRTVSGITWQKPTVGNVITQFGGSSKGVDIAGTAGQPVVAAADGKVVYAGSGLRGYGNLIIVQHNSTFLSAYGHNESLLVNEGQTVKRGQTIAKMGSSDASRTQLHFEVRQNGKPVNPATYVAF
ncbi:peptidoglycan DD-metalloendopeptidase family protein [Neisseria animalis]|uniref:LysM peptidoglycan-binding domain-containing protein n=1 Tax=Neisseria animalis TaxID=492 RepID=A0A5P3MSZ0_NEIAN|nr:peptidoglycan DD-metalloendopeptidase family protein [Neisseria animalis]QEY24570.1 LysM peptidoglycan-binding domain-containing protein [Neisseria animalis]ROW33016.1 LysM peptidoglycan-binding domain-containing protein [Neisseria animalis]VEE07385.1 membrane peptidase [Neisseria animalis]